MNAESLLIESNEIKPQKITDDKVKEIESVFEDKKKEIMHI